MKKTILCGLCALSLCAVVIPVIAEDTIKFSVNEADKARYEALIKRYKDDAAATTRQAEADIKASQDKFEIIRGESEKTILNAQTQIRKLQTDAEIARDNFERAQAEANAKIEDANRRIQKANDELRKNMEALANSSATDTKADTKAKK